MSSILKIKENRDFRKAYRVGKSFVTPYAVVYVMKNRRGEKRLGITVGKKVGKAVARNRAKRVITAAFRQIFPEILSGYDFVIVARPRILTVKSPIVEAALGKALVSAGVLEENE